MSTSPQQAQEYAAQTVATLFNDQPMRQEFMQAYASGPAAIKPFLMDRLGMPEDLAQDIVSRKDQELSNYIGQLVCDYLW